MRKATMCRTLTGLLILTVLWQLGCRTQEPTPEPEGPPGKITGVKQLIAAKQVHTYSDLQEKKAFAWPTKAYIYYKWKVENQWGYDFGEGEWDLRLEYADGTATVTLPPLQLLNSILLFDDEDFRARVINASWFVDEQKVKEAYLRTMRRTGEKTGRGMLSDEELQRICMLSVAEFLRSFFNQAPGTAPVTRVVVRSPGIGPDAQAAAEPGGAAGLAFFPAWDPDAELAYLESLSEPGTINALDEASRIEAQKLLDDLKRLRGSGP